MAKSEKGSEKKEKDDSSDKEDGDTQRTPREKRKRDHLYGKGEYRILGKKGEGTFSEVLKCQNIKDGTYWACKKMKQTYDSLDQVNNLREIQAMRRLAAHGNILELEEVIFDKKTGTLVLICELMDMNIYELIRGKRHYLPDRKIKNYMYQLVKSVEHMHSFLYQLNVTIIIKEMRTKLTGKRHLLPENVVRKYMYQLCKSVDHMHRNGIFHRDVKPENILIKEDLLKLADFGSCRSIYSKQPYTEYISTRWYRAPECLLTDGYYTYKMDIWSVGCVFFEILSLHPLFPGSNEVDQIAKIHDIMGTPESAVLSKFKKSRGMNFNFPPKKGTGIERMLQHASTDAVDLIYKLCTYDPDDRMTAKQALRHSYFKELRDNEKRQAALTRAKIADKEDIKPTTSPEMEKPKGDNYDKKKDSDIHILASLPKPQSLPAHQLFKDKRKVYQRRRKLGENNQTTYNSNHGGFFPKVPLHASTINPSYHSSSFPSTFTHTTSNQLSLLPSISSTYKTHKNPSTKTKNMFGHYQLPSLDRRGAGF